MTRHIPFMLAGIFCAGIAAAQDDGPAGFDFERHDSNGDGYLTEAEWQDAGIANADLASVDFARVDINRDGYLTAEEITEVQTVPGATSEVTVEDPDEGSPEEDYLGTGYDPLAAEPADNDVISAETEAAASGEIVRENVGATDGAIDFSTLDASQDDLVSREEAERDAQVEENFIAWDADQDGYLDERELEAARENASDTTSETTSGDMNDRGADTGGDVGQADISYDPEGRDIADAVGFTQLDADGDGRLSDTEAANDINLETHFDSWDANQDGYLETDEINAGWEQDVATPEENWPEESPEETEGN